MITEPGHFQRAVVLVNQGKANEARRLVRCLRGQGTRMFITGKPTRAHDMFVPVTIGDCSGETYRPYLLCPGDWRRSLRSAAFRSRRTRSPYKRFVSDADFLKRYLVALAVIASRRFHVIASTLHPGMRRRLAFDRPSGGPLTTRSGAPRQVAL
jgi:hypothetical protein